jgi:hypothetical protein
MLQSGADPGNGLLQHDDPRRHARAIAAEGGFAQQGLQLAKSRSTGLKSHEYALEAEAALFGARQHLPSSARNSARRHGGKPSCMPIWLGTDTAHSGIGIAVPAGM